MDRRRLNETSQQNTTNGIPEYVGELLNGGSAVEGNATLVRSKFSFVKIRSHMNRTIDGWID